MKSITYRRLQRQKRKRNARRAARLIRRKVSAILERFNCVTKTGPVIGFDMNPIYQGFSALAKPLKEAIQLVRELAMFIQTELNDLPTGVHMGSVHKETGEYLGESYVESFQLQPLTQADIEQRQISVSVGCRVVKSICIEGVVEI